MTVQNALLFLAATRRDEALRTELEAQQDDPGVLCRLGRARGLEFDASDLQQAFRHDWALRALREGKSAPQRQ
ncbi:MAG: Nif11-like leader peptide family natural product precursor [Pseudomonadota bacterium]